VDGAAGGLLAALLVAGLASGIHCAGMCGGIVTAFASARVIPIAAAGAAPRGAVLLRQLVFNGGRISSYAGAGAAAGLAGGWAGVAGAALPVQTLLYVVANAMLVLAGLYLMGAGRLLQRLEALGAPLWRRLQPLAARGLAARTLSQAYLGGLVWGWLPCGLVYGALAAAAFAGSPAGGALAMLVFGLGTLPTLVAMGVAAARLRAWFALRALRLAAGTLVLSFGALGLARAGGVAEKIGSGLCGL
jgi:sulfite exporter TauE/SafE